MTGSVKGGRERSSRFDDLGAAAHDERADCRGVFCDQRVDQSLDAAFRQNHVRIEEERHWLRAIGEAQIHASAVPAVPEPAPDNRIVERRHRRLGGVEVAVLDDDDLLHTFADQRIQAIRQIVERVITNHDGPDICNTPGARRRGHHQHASQ